MSTRTDRRRPPAAASHGFSLVEVMVVLVVLAVGIMALSAVQTRSSSDVYATGRATRALALAQSQIEQVRSRGYDLAAADSGMVDNLRWVTEVDSAGPDLRRVNVTVTWADPNSASRSLRLDTLLSDR
jgi:prepilin-type N-terminal cleavage/methylation domain-containing protein